MGRHPDSYGPPAGPSGKSGKFHSQSGPSSGPSGHSGRSCSRYGPSSDSSGHSGPFSGPSGQFGRSTGKSRSSSRFRSGQGEREQAERHREAAHGIASFAEGAEPQVEQYVQFLGPPGQFVIPQYSADGHLLGYQTGHYEQGRSGSREGSVPVSREGVSSHRAKVPKTEHSRPADPAPGGRRATPSEPPRQSSFMEARGKRRQQFDIVDVSSDDDDDANVGTGTRKLPIHLLRHFCCRMYV